MKARFRAAAVAVLMLTGGCLLEPVEEAGYPSEQVLSIPAGAAGVPVACDVRGDRAMGAAGSTIYLVDCLNEELLFTAALPDTVIDVALGEGWALVLLPDSIVPIALSSGQPAEGFGLPAAGVGVSAESGEVFVLCADGSILAMDEGSWQSPFIAPTGLAGAAAMAADSGGTILFVADPAASRIVRVEPFSGRVTAQVDVFGEVEDLEQACGGFCCSMQGSNEIWVMGPQCEVLFLLTYPDVPSCGAAMPGNSFFFAGIPGIGLVACAPSGEQVLLDPSYQGLTDIALSEDYAFLASSPDSSFYLLRR